MATPIVVNPKEPSPIIINGGNSSSGVTVAPKEPSKVVVQSGASTTPIIIDDNGVDYNRIEQYINNEISGNLDSKQDKQDNSLDTTSKTIVGAINELKGSIGSQTADGYIYDADKNSFVAGKKSVATGVNSFATGQNTVASGKQSHAGGVGNEALNEAQYVCGKYAITDTTGKAIMQVGVGSSTTNRQDGFVVYTDGTFKFGDSSGKSVTLSLSELGAIEGISVITDAEIDALFV